MPDRQDGRPLLLLVNYWWLVNRLLVARTADNFLIFSLKFYSKIEAFRERYPGFYSPLSREKREKKTCKELELSRSRGV